jgi:hypothetical protein
MSTLIKCDSEFAYTTAPAEAFSAVALAVALNKTEIDAICPRVVLLVILRLKRRQSAACCYLYHTHRPKGRPSEDVKSERSPAMALYPRICLVVALYW